MCGGSTTLRRDVWRAVPFYIGDTLRQLRDAFGSEYPTENVLAVQVPLLSSAVGVVEVSVAHERNAPAFGVLRYVVGKIRLHPLPPGEQPPRRPEQDALDLSSVA